MHLSGTPEVPVRSSGTKGRLQTETLKGVYLVKNTLLERTLKSALLASAGAAVLAVPALAQAPAAPAPAAAPAADASAEEEVVVTGSRIQRRDFVATSPIATVQGDALTANADITIDNYLNTLPQVNPAGGMTSNNPGNGTQANVDLRGLGTNRNLVLIDGRRPMVSSTAQDVDLNTIPAALIERVEVITGGAGATYGADAVAGVVNIILKKNFEGLDARANYANTSNWDAQEYSFSGVIGGNFADDKGNAVISIDRAYREQLTKGQREFARFATSTTTANPTGGYLPATNPVSQAAINALFATPGYGSVAPGIAQAALLGFNTDGTVFSRGIFNSPNDAVNFRYAIDSAAAPNTNFFPDFYTYNFDEVNLLVLPYERKSLAARANYEIMPGVEVFGQLMWTQYNSSTALAPTPLTPTQRGPGNTTTSINTSTLVQPSTVDCNPAVAGIQTCAVQGLIIPLSNPFIPADMRTLLASRTGDNVNLVGSGATEPFLASWRSLPVGLRLTNTENTVVQYLMGVDWDLGSGWSLHAYASEGKTTSIQTSAGGVDVSKVQQLLEAPGGGASLCAGGLNIFGTNPLSDACVTFIEATGVVRQIFRQQIAQAYVTGPLVELPAGDLQIVIGGEHRYFEYDFPPSVLNGPVVGPNTQAANRGTNSFTDFFAEALIPLATDESWAKRLELTIGYRYSESQFIDEVQAIIGEVQSDSAYKADLLWEVDDIFLVRGSYQRAVRAPNFGELFAGGNSFTQYFDPCSAGTAIRVAGGAAMTAHCVATGVPATSIASFVATPAGQFQLFTSGSTDLKPETADTFTIGLVVNSPWEDDPFLGGARLSIDYYNIKVKDLIGVPDPNVLLADCYNYYGTNPTLSATTVSCQAVSAARAGGGGQLANSTLLNPLDPTGNFAGINQGTVETDGFDVQFEMGFDMEALGLGEDSGSFAMNLLLTYVNSYKVTGIDLSPDQELAGTIPFFGQGLGQAFPEWKATANFRYSIDDLTADIRVRYIDAMKNKASVIWPGERFGGVPATWYIDLALGYQVLENVEVRIGVDNVLDQEPRIYTPNIQSGTDPSTYDVLGRRYFGQLNLRY